MLVHELLFKANSRGTWHSGGIDQELSVMSNTRAEKSNDNRKKGKRKNKTRSNKAYKDSTCVRLLGGQLVAAS